MQIKLPGRRDWIMKSNTFHGFRKILVFFAIQKSEQQKGNPLPGGEIGVMRDVSVPGGTPVHELVRVDVLPGTCRNGQVWLSDSLPVMC